ncbi:MAG: TldD/PmbA family protein [Oscillospiraceae bacterium]|jgi:PmbA protein|nr:TldD/PmbA family protein [Oscillospiraceae bacterium]MDR2360318.1 TldD/PmbA family protein [Oscillospiraceae bacterium]
MKQEFYTIVDKVFAKLKELGADGAEVSVSRGKADELNVDAGEFSLARTTISNSLGIRALTGSRKGESYINRCDDAAISQAAEEAVAAANNSEPDEAEDIGASIGEREFDTGWTESELGVMYDRMQDFISACKAEYPKADILQFITRGRTGDSLFANTNGTRVYQHGGYYTVSIGVSGRDGDKTSSMQYYGFSAEDLNKPFMDNAEVRRLCKEIELQIETVPVSGKFVGDVLVAPDCVADFIDSVLTSSVYGGSLYTGSSPWKDKLGQMVADSRLTVEFDPFDDRFVKGSELTSDGHLAEKHTVIENGILKSFICNRYSANKTGHKRAGNYGVNCIIAPGDKSFDELAASIGNGLVLNRFSGGNPASNGDFSGIAKNSFRIRGGKIAEAVSETMISGNLRDMLNNIGGIGNSQIQDGSIAVPWIVFRGVTISGK